MLKKIDVEVHSEGDCRRLLFLFFMSYHKLLYKWRIEVFSDRISRCYFFASCGTTDCIANGGLRCIQRG